VRRSLTERPRRAQLLAPGGVWVNLGPLNYKGVSAPTLECGDMPARGPALTANDCGAERAGEARVDRNSANLRADGVSRNRARILAVPWLRAALNCWALGADMNSRRLGACTRHTTSRLGAFPRSGTEGARDGRALAAFKVASFSILLNSKMSLDAGRLGRIKLYTEQYDTVLTTAVKRGGA